MEIMATKEEGMFKAPVSSSFIKVARREFSKRGSTRFKRVALPS